MNMTMVCNPNEHSYEISNEQSENEIGNIKKSPLIDFQESIQSPNKEKMKSRSVHQDFESNFK